MNKSELIDALSRHANLSKAQAEKAVNALVEVVGSTLNKGEKIQIQGFGSFEAKTRAARKGINPATMEPMTHPEKVVVRFAAGKTLIDRLNA